MRPSAHRRAFPFDLPRDQGAGQGQHGHSDDQGQPRNGRQHGRNEQRKSGPGRKSNAIGISVQSPVARLAGGAAPKKPGRGARRGASERRLWDTSGDMQRLKLLVEPLPATSSHGSGLYGMQEVRGFESPKLHDFTAQRHISIIEMIFDLLHAGKRISPRRQGFWHGSPRRSDTCRRSWPQEVTLKCPFPGSKTGSKPEVIKRSARAPRPSCLSPSCPAATTLGDRNFGLRDVQLGGTVRVA